MVALVLGKQRGAKCTKQLGVVAVIVSIRSEQHAGSLQLRAHVHSHQRDLAHISF